LDVGLDIGMMMGLSQFFAMVRISSSLKTYSSGGTGGDGKEGRERGEG
jgi:hypothetical protein